MLPEASRYPYRNRYPHRYCYRDRYCYRYRYRYRYCYRYHYFGIVNTAWGTMRKPMGTKMVESKRLRLKCSKVEAQMQQG